MNTAVTAVHVCTGVVISTHGHEWEACVPNPPGEWSAAKLPAPFDSWGPQTAWKLLSCGEHHSGSCAEATVAACIDSEARRNKLLQNYNLVFGVTRNKAYASAFRARKQAQADAEEAEREEEEEEEEDDGNEDDEADSSSDDGLVDVERDDVLPDDDEDDEDDAVVEEEVVSESSSSSDDSDAPPVARKPVKRGVKRTAPGK